MKAAKNVCKKLVTASMFFCFVMSAALFLPEFIELDEYWGEMSEVGADAMTSMIVIMINIFKIFKQNMLKKTGVFCDSKISFDG